MKRYIKSARSAEFLEEKEMFRSYLKEQQLGLSDQDIEDMVNDAYPDQPRDLENVLTPELKKKIYKEFGRKDGVEICDLIQSGYTVDSAIQTVLGLI